MKKLLVAAIAFGGLCFAASANAGVIPTGVAASHAVPAAGLTEVSHHSRHHMRRHVRRPVCKTVIKRERVGHHRWVQRRVRVCR
jgi:hypothetical protein